MSQPLVRTSVDHGIATILLDSPGNRNALSTRLRVELLAALAAAAHDDAVRVVVLGHTGPVFCAGRDLTEPGPDDPATALPAVLDAIWSSPTPVVARLSGAARAGGVGIVAACDLAVAADDVTFAFSEVRLGVVPAVLTAVVLRRVVAHAAHELFLTGAPFDAARAVHIGLLTRAVAAGEVGAVAAELAGQLRSGGPRALAATKAVLRQGQPSLAAAMAAVEPVGAASLRSDEAREGIRAFAEKRRPAWLADDTGVNDSP